MAKKTKSAPTAADQSAPNSITPMRVEVVALGDMNPAPYNPRIALKPGDEAWKRIERSLQTFGMVEPLVFNRRTGHLVGGHQRWAVLRHHGHTEAQASVVDLPLEQEKLLNLALNKVGGEWDTLKLGDLLEELGDFPDIEVAGFSGEELEALLTAETQRTQRRKGGEDRGSGIEAGEQGQPYDPEPPGGGTRNPTAGVAIHVGPIAFEVPEKAWARWLKKLENEAGTGEEEQEREIRKRLGFTRGK